MTATRKTQGFIDLFCGAGGFSWGWEKAGFHSLAAIDSDVPAVRTYELNFGVSHPLIFNRDISKFSPKKLSPFLGKKKQELLAVIGGPPCQGWSKVGRGKIKSLDRMASSMLRDPRNRLYKHFLKYVEYFRPAICVMENVPGMLSVGGKNVARVIERHFENAGYVCSHGLVNAVWFGTPQYRERLIFIGVRKNLGVKIDVEEIKLFAEKFRSNRLNLPEKITVSNAISDLPPIQNGGNEDPLIYRGNGSLSKYARLMRETSNGILTDHVCRDNPQDVEAFRTMRQGMKYVQLESKFKRYRDDIFKDKYKKLIWGKPSWTVTAHLSKDCYTHIHSHQSRTLSVREAARLQGFVDSFRFFGNMGERFRQIGNAVPPLMAWGIAEFVKKKVAARIR